MTKYEIWKDLRSQVKIARKDRDEQRKAITKCEWTSDKDEKSCIKVIQVQTMDLNVPAEGLAGNYEVIEKGCENFGDEPCHENCPMLCANREYFEAEKVLSALKRARNKAFWDMFIRSK